MPPLSLTYGLRSISPPCGFGSKRAERVGLGVSKRGGIEKMGGLEKMAVLYETLLQLQCIFQHIGQSPIRGCALED